MWYLVSVIAQVRPNMHDTGPVCAPQRTGRRQNLPARRRLRRASLAYTPEYRVVPHISVSHMPQLAIAWI